MSPETNADEQPPAHSSVPHDDGPRPVPVANPQAAPGSIRSLPWWAWLAVLIGLAIFLWFMLDHFLQVPPV